MSSSLSSAASSMRSMSVTSSSRLTSPSEYRVAEYYDGQVVRIHESRRRPHVTGLAKQSSSSRHERPVGAYASIVSKAKPIIIQSPMPIRTSKSETLTTFEKLGMLTPPQTPKIQRLETPEIEELDDIPFCNCCADTQFIKLCTSCGSRLH